VKGGVAAALLSLTAVVATNWCVFDASGAYPDLGAGETDDAALVPGCFAGPAGPAPMLAARLEAALGLYRSGRVRRIFVTGNEQTGETTAMEHWLVAHGVPGKDIVADGQGTRTLESAKRAAQVYGIQSAVICTQKLHLARTLFLAREAGIRAEGTDVGHDLGGSLRWQAVEALKRTVAFAEARMLGKLERRPAATVAMH
jgi:SanA protein